MKGISDTELKALNFFRSEVPKEVGGYHIYTYLRRVLAAHFFYKGLSRVCKNDQYCHDWYHQVPMIVPFPEWMRSSY